MNTSSYDWVMPGINTWKLTRHLKLDPWKRKVLLQTHHFQGSAITFQDTDSKFGLIMHQNRAFPVFFIVENTWKLISWTPGVRLHYWVPETMPAQSKPGPMLAVVAGTLTVTRLTFNKHPSRVGTACGRSMDRKQLQQKPTYLQRAHIPLLFQFTRVYPPEV